MKRFLALKRFVVLLCAILLACLCFACGKLSANPGGGATAAPSETTPASTATAETQTQMAASDALHLLFDYLFDEEEQEAMQYFNFIDNDTFLGCEYQIFVGANPRQIEYWGISSDESYYIFWLNEQVYHDGEFSHATTGDFIAVHMETREIIRERDNAPEPDDWNDNFPW